MARFFVKLLFVVLIQSHVSFSTNFVSELINENGSKNGNLQGKTIAINEELNDQYSLFELPDEILLRIALHLLPIDNAQLGLTCSHLSQITSDDNLWFFYYTSLPERNISDSIDYDTVKPDDYKNLIQQYYLLLKIFILDIQGKGHDAQKLLTVRFPKLNYTNYNQNFSKKTIIQMLNYNPIHHDSSLAYDYAQNIYKELPSICNQADADFQNDKATRIIHKLLLQRQYQAIEDYFADIRQQFAHQTAEILALNTMINNNPDRINTSESDKKIRDDKTSQLNLEKVQKFVDQLIAEGGRSGDTAINFKFEGIYFGDYGYLKNIEKAKELVYNYYNQRHQNNKWYMSFKLRDQFFSFQSNTPSFDQIDLGDGINSNQQKFNKVFHCLFNEASEGRNEAKKLLEELMADNYEPAFSKYFHEILWNHQLTREDNFEAVNWLENMVIKVYPWAIQTKLLDLNNNQFYKLDEAQTKEFIEQQCAVKNIEAILLKSLGLGYGLYGYERDVSSAIKMIKQYKVHPFVLKTNLHLLR